MRKALIVGINHYQNYSPLHGCINDALSVKNVLERNEDGTKNFDCVLFCCEDESSLLNRGDLKDNIRELFSGDADIALFYFAGHGYIESTDGYLATSENSRGDDGLALSEILKLANDSKAKNKIIMLDSCHSGMVGNLPNNPNTAFISEGVTILTASTQEQYASEENGQGVFTTLLIDALNGAAANLMGEISPGSIYAHIDQSLSAWEQRPIFKTNVKNFVALRKVKPIIELHELRKITEFFPTKGFEYQLNPTYEPEIKGRDKNMPNPIEENTKLFAILQKYNRINLLVSVDVKHMWNAAMESKSCKLTALGEHYRKLVLKGRI